VSSMPDHSRDTRGRHDFRGGRHGLFFRENLAQEAAAEGCDPNRAYSKACELRRL
jgi:hypothetical protein